MTRLPRIKIHSSTVLLFAGLALLNGGIIPLIAFGAALCHELGHLAVMRWLGVKVEEIEITLFGAEIRTPYLMLGTFGSVAVYFAGAAANMLTAAVACLLRGSFAADYYVVCSLSLAFFNLLPIRTLDGGCILDALCLHFFPRHVGLITNVVSALTLGFLWLVSAYLLLTFDGNVSLMLFCIYMFVSLYLR